MENKEQFYPIMSNVLQMIADVAKSSNDSDKTEISRLIRNAITDANYVFNMDLHLAFALRILSESGSEEDMLLIGQIYEQAPAFIRRDIMLIYAKAAYWYPLSNLRAKYSSMSPWEKRAFYLSSYTLADEGKHWRDSVKGQDDVRQEFRDWCSKQKNNQSTRIRL